MRISRISVTELFGMFDHDIPLSEQDRVTIIHGPNGYGKTIILKMLNGLFNSRYSTLRSIPFKQFSVTFEDNSILAVNKENYSDKKQVRQQCRLLFSLDKGNGKLLSFTIDDPISPIEFPLHMIDDFIPHLERIDSEVWKDLRSGKNLDLSDVVQEYHKDLPGSIFPHDEIPEWFSSLIELISVRLIETERLRLPSKLDRRRRDADFNELAVRQYANELRATIRNKLAESAALSQSLDRTFPVRLVKQNLPINVTEKEIRLKLEKLEKKRYQLSTSGLLDKEEQVNFQIASQAIEEHTMQVLTVYAEDIEKKLSVFNELSAKIELFETLINNRFRYKNISISKQEGFVFTGADKTRLEPSDLSSGEQQELVLLYELLFKVNKDSLILIDEPEISLHVVWQEEFLNDLHKITELSPFDVLMATHSPQIINDRWDLTVELKGPDTVNNGQAK